MPAGAGTATGTPELQALCARHGGAFFIQHGHDLNHPQKPPRHYWLIFDQPRNPGPNTIRTAARIERSWGMTVRLAEQPGYRRTLDSLSMTYVLRGRGFFLDPAGRHEVRAGDLMLLFPGVPHAYGPEPGERWDEISVFFGGPVFEAWRQPGLLDPAAPVRHLEPVDYWLERFHETLLPLARSEAVQTAADWGRLVALVAEMASAWQAPRADPDMQWLDRARQCLRTLPAGRAPDWARVAGELGVSSRTLRRRFKGLSGLTPGEFINRRRIDQARRLLLESDAKVSDVALELRFANEFHFSRRFKQLTGLSPRAYRELHQNR